MSEALQELGEFIDAAQGEAILARELAYGELTLLIKAESLVEFMTFLRDDQNCQFKQLQDVAGADYPDREDRLEVIYHLLSPKHNQRLRVKVSTDENTPVDSLSEVFSSAIWFEREAWDLYGILFAGHPDLRRILTDYGFEGHPLRKDFPLTGYVEVRYDQELGRVVYEPVKLAQEFRSFDFMSPWEGMLHLPGDEKAEEAEAKEGEG